MIALLPEPGLRAIGRVIAAWSHLEQTFDMIYMFRVIRDNRFELDDPRLRRLAAPFKIRIGELRSVLRQENPPNLQAWESALSKVGNLRDKRDVVAHGWWNAVPIPDGNEILVEESRLHLSFKSYRNEKPHDWGIIKIATIDNRADQIDAVQMELLNLMQVTECGKPHIPHHLETRFPG